MGICAGAVEAQQPNSVLHADAQLGEQALGMSTWCHVQGLVMHVCSCLAFLLMFADSPVCCMHRSLAVVLCNCQATCMAYTQCVQTVLQVVQINDKGHDLSHLGVTFANLMIEHNT